VNLTDPQSRIQRTRKGWVQGYNAQFAVTGEQIIVACSASPVRCRRLPVQAHDRPVTAVAARLAEVAGTGMAIGTVLADAG